MTRAFELVRAVETLLDSYSENGTLFEVSGIRRRVLDAQKVNEKPRVYVFLASADTKKDGRSTSYPPYANDCTITIVCNVVEKAQANLEVLADPDSTQEQRAEALSGMNDAYLSAKTHAEDLAALLYKILMSPVNQTLGLPYDPKRWVTGTRFEFSDPESGGEISFGATLTMSATTYEDNFFTETGVPNSVVEPVRANFTPPRP